MKKLLVFILVFSFAISMSACQLLMQEVQLETRDLDSATLSSSEISEIESMFAENQMLTFDEMTTADRWEINTVLSHFVDTGLKSFDRTSPSETDLFRFVQSNTYYHNYQKIQMSDDGQYYYLTADDVAATLREYFDLEVEQPLAISEPTFYKDDAYYWPCADGDMATEFASVSSIQYLADSGLYQVDFDVFSPYDLFTMEIEGYYSFSHDEIAARDDLTHVGSGTAQISYQDGSCTICSIQVN
jgi:hypothetical protein